MLRLSPRLPPVHCIAPQPRYNSSGSSIKALQELFRDPKSPYHIRPGTNGPSSPEDIPDVEEIFRTKGFDTDALWEQKIVWGDMDAFQHVNNVRYIRFFESSRTHWMHKLGRKVGGNEVAENMLRGKGVSLILKEIQVRFRRPVTFPDTLLIGHRPQLEKISEDKSILHMTASAFSLKQQEFVAFCDEVVVWYDYDKLKKTVPEQKFVDALKSQ